jgi:hypothetical protein
MAAHGLTIARQCRAYILADNPDDKVVTFVARSLDAPGLDCSVGFSGESYLKLWFAQERVERGEGTSVEILLPVIDQIIQDHMWMDEYPSMDAIEHALLLFVRKGTPHWKNRLKAFDEKVERALKKARSLITDRWPLTHRAPTVLMEAPAATVMEAQ